MAKWRDHQHEPVYIGNAFGDPVEMRVGVVDINGRVTVGLQTSRDNPRDRPDFTMDVAAVTDLIAKLQVERSKLIKETGGL